MVLVEAAIARKPLVSCEIGSGTSFVNQDGETGFVVPPESPGALAQALRRLLDDARLAERLGAGARRRYEQNFSGDALGRGYAAVFREALGQ
jgi:rhamnosyl/mannosyltransferase